MGELPGMKPPKFRTTVEGEPHRDTGRLPRFQPYGRLDDVPQPVRQKIREIWRKGIQSQEIADLIEIPLEWVQILVGEIRSSNGDGNGHNGEPQGA